MSLIIGFSIVTSIIGLLALALFGQRKFRQHRELIEFLAKQNDELQESLAASKDRLENIAKRLSDQSRRIAWLETQVRQPKLIKEEILDKEILDNTPKSNMTERRHRVLTLAARGLDSKKIASTLGMMPGEVELIINLNRVSAA